ncbi:MAG: lamin tail domain-containing protein [Pontiellaceae bacterium]|nr:lamin tail domain-containing protein [Pontiellaceae bacterium]
MCRRFLTILALLAMGGAAASAVTLEHRYSFVADASDEVGNADGVLLSGAVVVDGAVEFNGNSAYVELPAGLMTEYHSMTVECWGTDYGSSTWARIFDFGSGTSTYLFMTPNSGAGDLRVAIKNGGGEQLVSAARQPIGEQKHIVWSYDYDSTTVQLYVDGVQVASNTGVTIAPADLGITMQNWLGRSQWPDPYFYGSIDEFRIYDGALSAEEVAESYSAGPDVVPFSEVSITRQPEDLSVVEGSSARFEIGYVGAEPVSVQWYRDDVPLEGKTNAVYDLESVSLGDDGAVFFAEVMNELDGNIYLDVSSNATLSVYSDTVEPSLERVDSLYPTGVLVRFSEAVDQASAETVANYTIDYNGGTLAVQRATLLSDGMSVELETAAQTLDVAYTLHVSHVQDSAVIPNVIAADSQLTFVASEYIAENIGGASGTAIWQSGGGELSVTGSGVGDTTDQIGFGYKTYTGDFDVQVRVESMEFSDVWAQCGLMARNGLEANAAFAAVYATPGPAGCQVAARTTAGGSTVTDGFFPTVFPEMWLRLRRTGNLFEGFAGTDGQTWERLGAISVSMPLNVDVGFFAGAGKPSGSCTASLRDADTGSGTIVSRIDLPFEPLGPSSRRVGMVISEIMVDTPSEWGGTNSLEFVELYNSGLITEDLTGHRFSGEIDYTFPAGTTLAPGEFLVVAKDPAAAQAFYGVDCLGPYDGKLANSGGTLRFRNEVNGILQEVEYDNRAPWPVAAFGTGHSLVLSHPSYGENDARAWSASDRVGGSPGTTESYGAEPLRGVVINEYFAHTDLPQVDYIELFNTTAQPIDLSGAWLSDEAGTNKYQIAEGTTIGPRGFKSFDQNALGFALSADGEQIYLMNADQTRGIDALAFRGQANGISEGRYPDGAPDIQALSTVTKGTANTNPRQPAVVINEIMYHPISESNDDEYVELYNRTTSAVDVSGWRLQGGISYQFPDETEIPANGYIVVAENATNLMARYAQLDASNTYGNYGGTLGNGGDTIRLTMPEDLVATNLVGLITTNYFYITVDEVTYLDGGRWTQWSDGGGSSLELTDPDADNRQPANWADSDDSDKAPWTTIDVTDYLVNGGMVAPDYIELYLQGAGEVLLDDVGYQDPYWGDTLSYSDFSDGSTGWSFGGVVRNSFVEEGVGVGDSAALHLVSVGRGDIGCNNASVMMNYAPSTGSSETGRLMAKVRWLKGTRYFLMRLRGNWMEASLPLEVPTNCGTPGLPNSQWVANAGPAIYDVSHSPVLPEAGENVVVTARAVDPDGIASISLNYRIDPDTTYSTVAMNDNGTGGDAVAGDGIYSATISAQSSGTLAAFYVSAVDGLSAGGQFPANVPTQECLVRWGDEEIAGSLGTYRLWVTQANLDFWSSRERNANDNIDATFVYGNDRVIYNVGTMYSASPFHTGAYNGPIGSFACDYEINFQTGECFLGAEPFVLSAEGAGDDFWFDYSTQVDMTSTWIARKLGQQYNYRRHVNMVVNGNRRGMVYLDTQQPNGDMLEQYYPNDSEGELRKIEDWMEFQLNDTSFDYITATLQRFDDVDGNIDTKRYRWGWRPRTTENQDQWFAFTNMVAAVNDTQAADYESRVRNWVDIRNFLRPIAVNRICGNWDSYGYERGKNMYIYKPDDSGWRLLPWDIELALGNGSRSPTDPINDFHDPALRNLILNTPAFYREYLMALQEAVDLVLLPEVVNPILDERYENLIANGIPVASPNSIEVWIASRRSYLQSVLPTAGFAVDATDTTVSSNRVVLTGSAPLQVAEIWVNGKPYPVEWVTTTSWRLTLPLNAGANTLLITGRDRFGNEVDGANAVRNITFSGADLDPEGVVVFSEIHPSPDDRAAQFLELHNASTNHIFDLSGWRINGVGYTFPEGAVIEPGEYLLLVADRYQFAARRPDVSIEDEYDGSLDPLGETLTLFRPGEAAGEEIVVDRVRYENAAPWSDFSGGYSLQLVDPALDNARVANWVQGTEGAKDFLQTETLVANDHTWKYYSDVDPGTGWETVGFDDSRWSSGPSLIYQEGSTIPWTKNTPAPYVYGRMSYYFRTTFDYAPGGGELVELDLTHVIDDGMILYLNGTEIDRWGMPDGAVDASTPASQVVGNAGVTGPYFIPSDALVIGENVLAVEVHQATTDSSDVVMGIQIDAVLAYPDESTIKMTTPGAANCVPESMEAIPPIWLNELQAVNVSGAQDNVGDRDPWIELYNAGDSVISLDGYYLTDDYSNLIDGWAFPAGSSVPAGGTLVVWCDGETEESVENIPHADFSLTATSGQVGLYRMVGGNLQMVDYLTYADLPANWGYGDMPDGQPFYRFDLFYATPGVTNNGASAPITVSINEWMADNNGTLMDPVDYDYDDWFELYNPGTNTVDLGGYFLTDDLTDPFQFQVPNNGHYTIEPGGILLVWADGEDGQNSTNVVDLHADFSLSRGGEAIGVFAADGTMIDSVTFTAQDMDASDGRFPDGAPSIFAMKQPTPRTANEIEQQNSAPVLSPIDDVVLVPGLALEFMAAAVDADSPAQTLSYSLTNAPSGASIVPLTGLFRWTPSLPTTNLLGVVVTDNGVPALSDTEWFEVKVVPVPSVGAVSMSGSEFSLNWLSQSGLTYRIYYKEALTDPEWQAITPPIAGNGELQIFNGSTTNAPTGFIVIGVEP